MSIESVMPSNHLSLCRPLLLCLQSGVVRHFGSIFDRTEAKTDWYAICLIAQPSVPGEKVITGSTCSWIVWTNACYGLVPWRRSFQMNSSGIKLSVFPFASHAERRIGPVALRMNSGVYGEKT